MSDESIDLIRKMLNRDLSTRPTMAQVIAHPVLPYLGTCLTCSGSPMSFNWIGWVYVRASERRKNICFGGCVNITGVYFWSSVISGS